MPTATYTVREPHVDTRSVHKVATYLKPNHTVSLEPRRNLQYPRVPLKAIATSGTGDSSNKSMASFRGQGNAVLNVLCEVYGSLMVRSPHIQSPISDIQTSFPQGSVAGFSFLKTRQGPGNHYKLSLCHICTLET